MCHPTPSAQPLTMRRGFSNYGVWSGEPGGDSASHWSVPGFANFLRSCALVSSIRHSPTPREYPLTLQPEISRPHSYAGQSPGLGADPVRRAQDPALGGKEVKSWARGAPPPGPSWQAHLLGRLPTSQFAPPNFHTHPATTVSRSQHAKPCALDN